MNCRSKFHVADVLASHGTNFLFMEMDIWLVPYRQKALRDVLGLHFTNAESIARRRALGIRSLKGRLNGTPQHILSDGTDTHTIDILASTHQDVPHAMNIGWFSVVGSPKTHAFFARLLELLLADDLLKDQRAFINLCRHPETPADMWGGVFALLPPIMVTSHTRPVISGSTLAVHVLSTRPLTVMNGKQLMAKERLVYQEHPEERGAAQRLVALDRPLSLSSRDINHRPHFFRSVLSVLTMAAARTNRTMVLPWCFNDEAYFYPWAHFDLEPVERLGVRWKEANFLRRVKLRRSQPTLSLIDPSLSHHHAEGDRESDRRREGEDVVSITVHAHSVGVAMGGTGTENLAWYAHPARNQRGTPLRTLWQTLDAVEQHASATTLVLLHLPVMDGAKPERLHALSGDSGGLVTGSSTNEGSTKASWTREISQRLRWCNAMKPKSGTWEAKPAEMAIAPDDCYGRGIAVPENSY